MGEMEENRSYVLVLKTCEMEVTPFRHPVWAMTMVALGLHHSRPQACKSSR